jgi:hypothetical protein
MAAGLGFKDFQTGEVLTAADVDGYLMQGIWVFDDAAARDAAVTSPEEGNACYLKDTNEVLTYSGSVWVAVGGGSPLTTKGDLYGFSTVDARIPIGANDTVLTADSGETLGLKWAAPAAGGLTLINAGGTTLTGASVSITSIPTTYVNLLVIVRNFKPASDGQELNLQFNSDTGTNYSSVVANGTNLTVNTIWMRITDAADDTVANGSAATTIYDYANTTTVRIANGLYWGNSDGSTSNFHYRQYGGIYKSTGTAITSIQFKSSSGNFTSGTVFVYGVK